MVKDVNKPKGRTSSYAFFVLSCREEHKKKSPGTTVNFAKFSKTCSERWKTLAATEKKKFEDQAKADKDRYDREMMNYVPPKGMGRQKKKKDPNAPKRPPSAFFVFCSEHRPTVKGEYPGLTIGDLAKKLAAMWAKQSPKDRTPYEQKAAALRQKYEKDIAEYRAKGGAGGGAPKRGPGRPAGSTKKAMVKADDEDDEDEDEDEDDDEDEEEDDEDDE